MSRPQITVTISSLERAPEVRPLGKGESILLRRKGRVGFIEVEINDAGVVRVRGWGKLMIQPQAGNVTDIWEEKL